MRQTMPSQFANSTGHNFGSVANPSSLWLVTICGVVLATLAGHFISQPATGGFTLANTVSLLRQLFGSFALSAGILLLSIAALYLFRTPAQPQRVTAAQRPSSSRPAAPKPASTTTTDAGASFRRSNNPAPLPTTAVPTPLAQHAAVLLDKALTVPNFATTPLPGQRRVLQKLAENFVPAAQRGAALSLALFRLRQPRAA